MMGRLDFMCEPCLIYVRVPEHDSDGTLRCSSCHTPLVNQDHADLDEFNEPPDHRDHHYIKWDKYSAVDKEFDE
jgi:hypothetical protein